MILKKYDIMKIGLVSLRFDRKCFNCPFDYSLSLEIDHIIPKSKGGTNDVDNFCLLCPKCNKRKLDLMPNEFFTNEALDELQERLNRTFTDDEIRTEIACLVRIADNYVLQCKDKFASVTESVKRVKVMKHIRPYLQQNGI